MDKDEIVQRIKVLELFLADLAHLKIQAEHKANREKNNAQDKKTDSLYSVNESYCQLLEEYRMNAAEELSRLYRKHNDSFNDGN